MPKRRKKTKKGSASRDFLKLLGALAVLGVLLWFWQQKSPPQVTKPKEATPSARAEPETKPIPSSEKSETKSAKTLSALFPSETWPDDYHQIPISFVDDREGLLVSLGLAPPGKNPDEIRDPDQLRPALLVVKKDADQLTRKDLFDFSTPGPTMAGIRGSDLRGLARITTGSLLDLDHNGQHEIVTSVDTAGEFAQALAFLKWQGGRLQWIKARDKSGHEKIALWLTGSTSLESEEVTMNGGKGKGTIEVIHKKGTLDPKAPQKGFVWTTTYWELREGILVEK